ncbi:hypothetical protein ZWY2020_007127 [Hordeum vulgare]|nr:hypothetical protein ZWY2020_007127 [Hordeum vulgare]
MDRYQRVEKPRPEAAAISENEIRITTQGLIRNYVTYATSLLQEKRVKEIVLKAMGQAISKTVAITEIIKKRIPGLHQDTTISSVSITDVWEPIEEGLVPLEMTRHVSMISISLSPKELDTNSPGYQAPLHAEPLKPRYQQVQRYQQQHQPRQNQVQTDSYGRGRGRGRGRGWGGRGGYGGGYGGEVTVTREGTVKTKVAMEGVMVMTKVDMGDMIMVAGTTTRTEAGVAVGEEEATGDTVVQDTSAVDEVQAAQVAQAAGATCGAVVGWVLAAGGATRTIRLLQFAKSAENLIEPWPLPKAAGHID